MKKTAFLYFLIPYLILVVAGFTVCFTGSHGDFVLWVNQRQNDFFNATMPYFTWLGDGIAYALVVLVLIMYQWRMGLVFGVMGLCQFLLSHLLKKQIFAGTPRPKSYFSELNVPLVFVEGVKVYGYQSFPSGHTMTAFAAAVFLVLLFKKSLFSVFMLMIAVLVGFSRIYLLQHFLIDVCVGSVVGVLLGTSFYLIFRDDIETANLP